MKFRRDAELDRRVRELPAMLIEVLDQLDSHSFIVSAGEVPILQVQALNNLGFSKMEKSKAQSSWLRCE